MSYWSNHVPFGIVLFMAIPFVFSSSLGAAPIDGSPGEEPARRAEETSKKRCVAFRVGGLMKTNSGAT